MAIPKQINFIWMQGWGSSFPDRLRPNVQSVIDKNPGYKFLFWDEKSIREVVKSLGPQYLDKWESFPYMHQKIDMGRYVILYQNGGGISVDTDVVALKGFDSTPSINTSDLIVSYNSSNAFENYIKNGKSVSLNNATILASPKNEILKGLIDHILGLSCEINARKENCIQSTTGPKEFTNYLNQYKDQITILPNVYFEPCGGSDPYCSIPEESLLDHRHEGSWVSESSKTISRIWYWTKENWILPVSLILIIILFSTSKTKTV